MPRITLNRGGASSELNSSGKGLEVADAAALACLGFVSRTPADFLAWRRLGRCWVIRPHMG
jgi:hypothetical protein